VADLPMWLQQAIPVVYTAIQNILTVMVVLIPYTLWFVFCVKGINWRKMAPTLREGAWLPAVLLVVLVALVWSQASPQADPVFGVFPNFSWQLGAVSMLGFLGLFAGWVQMRYRWMPMEIAVEPPAHGHGAGHGHGHAHANNHDVDIGVID
jgi:hypothetical protein